MIAYVQLDLTLTISFNSHFHMRRKEAFLWTKFQWHKMFWNEILLSELMLIKNASADIVIYKATKFE